MRLQVTVLRNGLAPVRNVFNTTSRQYASEKIVLISDLLHAINQTVQLEDDENWGFEDYIVETRLNDNQSEAYECFHYQAVEDVLKDDDEITIRPLSATEIKQRERGGRYQINAGGMHLIDGSPWGRGFAVGRSRPRISIPPRRKSAALDGLAAAGQIAGLEEDEDQSLEHVPQQLQIEDTPRVSATTIFDNAYEDDSDEEEDEDFTDGSENEDSEISDDEAMDTYDHTSHGENGTPHVMSDWEALQAGLVNELHKAKQLEAALVKVEADDEADHSGSSSKKRKRLDDSQGTRKTRLRVDMPGAESNSTQDRDSRQGRRTVRFKEAASGSSSEDDSDSDDSTSSSDKSGAAETVDHFNDDGGVGRPAGEAESNDSDSVDEIGLTSDSKHNSTKNVAPRADSSAESESDTDTDTDSDSSSNSDSNSDSLSDSSSDSDSSDSEDESEASKDSVENAQSTKPPVNTRPQTATRNPLNVAEINHGPESTLSRIDSDTHQIESKQIMVPPGHGMSKTRRNNDRKKRSKLMARLKEEGKLPQEADFQMLRTYLEENTDGQWPEPTPQDTNMPDAVAEESHNDEATSDALNARKQEIFDMLNVSGTTRTESQTQTNPTPTDPVVTTDYPMTTVTQSLEASPASKLQAVVPPAEEVINTEVEVVRESQGDEPSPKRARLDLASSRRMLFSALGVRNPKTPAAEQALREKLSRPSREVKPREAESKATITAATEAKAQDRWRSKLIIKAVECQNRKKNIEVPSFPFKHPWQIRQEKDQGIYEEQDESFYAEDLEKLAVVTEKPPVEHPQTHSQAFTSSRTLTAGSQEAILDDLPIPSDFDVLFDLQPTDLVVGAVIAYKELHLNQNYEPTPSPYRVAKLVSKDDDSLRLRLASRYRDSNDNTYDENTGERVYNKLDLPIDEDQDPDDGLRELSFRDLIEPKFVSPSESAEIVVAASQIIAATSLQKDRSAVPSASLRGGDISTQESPMKNDKAISTSRRAEINSLIKEAGFESGLDDQLLQPLSEQGQHPTDSPMESDRQPTELTQVTQPDLLQGTSQALLTSQDSDWISTSDNLFSTPIGPIVETEPQQQSSLSESLVESVRYPNLSQLDVTPLPVPAHSHSSSHQDAQRLTPAPGETSGIAITLLSEATNNQQISQTKDSSNSMPSVIPETQAVVTNSAQSEVNEISMGDAPEKVSLSPIPSLDGSFSPRPQTAPHSESSLQNPQDSSDELDKLPSIRSLTSSQIRKINGHKRADLSEGHEAKTRSSSSVHKTRRSPRISKVDSQDLQDDDEFSETESPSSSYKAIKSSASQKERARPSLSQIPEDTIVVDLTQSSPAASPQNKPARKSTRTSTGSSSAFKRAFEGLGERSMLKKKKKTSL